MPLQRDVRHDAHLHGSGQNRSSALLSSRSVESHRRFPPGQSSPPVACRSGKHFTVLAMGQNHVGSAPDLSKKSFSVTAFENILVFVAGFAVGVAGVTARGPWPGSCSPGSCVLTKVAREAPRAHKVKSSKQVDRRRLCIICAVCCVQLSQIEDVIRENC